METAKTGMTHPWWQAGVFASAPAIFLWACAQLPADMLGNLFHAGTSPDSLMHVGDTLFVVGWTASGVLLWHGRRRIAPQVTETASPGAAVDAAPGARTRTASRHCGATWRAGWSGCAIPFRCTDRTTEKAGSLRPWSCLRLSTLRTCCPG